ncbi:MAG: mismatch repair protein [Acidobacteriota bacterium]|nr:mismatch repair protein [Acidobacteriota bacterium]
MSAAGASSAERPELLGDPHAAYSSRLESSAGQLAAKQRNHVRLGNFKLLTLAAGALVLWLSLSDHAFAIEWFIFPVAIYFGLVLFHRRTLHSRRRLESECAYFRRGIARIEDRWAGGGTAGERFRGAKSLYAEDIDIFGRGSLFELLSTARTAMGEDTLAAWLLAPSSVVTIAERQAMVAELRTNQRLRESLGMAGEQAHAEFDSDALSHWAEQCSGRLHRGFRVASALLAVSAIATFVYGIATGDYLPFLIVLALEGGIMLRLWNAANAATQQMGSGGEGIRLLAQIIGRIETEEFSSPRLANLRADLRNHGANASQALRRLAALADWIDARDSMFIKIIEIPLLYTVQAGLAAESWRQRWGGRVHVWLEEVGEIEALLSLATYSFEHPQDPFPELAPAAGTGAIFEGEALGHPLIPAAKCVRNSVRIGGDRQVLLVSGSNMSGKSTLLRTVGINTVLAMAGAPVRAQKLRLSPLILGTRIRTEDSLQEGQSRFFAEILRIRQVLELTEDGHPLLFLFDELLGGTNSRDRRIGAEGLVRSLVKRGAIGVVTTHDLALTEITTYGGNSVHNVHFQEHIEDGKMTFDYVLREGPVETSNALELMRWIGLDV